MRTIQELITEAGEIYNWLDSAVPNDLSSLMENLAQLEVYLARANEMVAEAKFLRDTAMSSFIITNESVKTLSASLAMQYLKTSVSQENYAVELADGLTSALKSIIDSHRTRISDLKEEIRGLRSYEMYEQKGDMGGAIQVRRINH